MLSKEDINLIVSQFKQKLQESWQSSEEDCSVLMNFVEEGQQATDLATPMLCFLMRSVALEFLGKVFQDQLQNDERNEKLNVKWLGTQFNELKKQWLEIEKQIWNYLQPEIDRLESESRGVSKIVVSSFLGFLSILASAGLIVLMARNWNDDWGGPKFPGVLLSIICLACAFVECGSAQENIVNRKVSRIQLASLKKLMPLEGKQFEFEEDTQSAKTALVEAGIAEDVAIFITSGRERLRINHEKINNITLPLQDGADRLKELGSSDTSDQKSASDHAHHGKEEEETSSYEMASVSMH